MSADPGTPDLATSEGALAGGPSFNTARWSATVDRDRLGPLGLWTFDFDTQPFAVVRDTVERLDESGTTCVWVPELFGRDATTQAAMILGATRSLAVANGIARIDWRPAKAMAAAAMALADAYPGRHVLGLGVGPFPGGDAFAYMGDYLAALDAAQMTFPVPAVGPPRLLAAHGPKMAEFAAAHTAGVHTYLVTTDHTADVRKRIGPDAFLAVEQAVVLGSGRDEGRAHVAFYLQTPYNRNKFLRSGFDEDDLSGPGSDRLVDAHVAHGDAATVAARLREQLAAGADHVAVQILGVRTGPKLLSAWDEIRAAFGCSGRPAVGNSGPTMQGDAGRNEERICRSS